MSATKTLITADELLAMPADGYRYELIKGELYQMTPAGFKHGATAMKLGARLEVYVEDNDLGIVCAAETGFRIATEPDTVRAPDVAFVTKARIDEHGQPNGYWPGTPDLAVEVISPSDRYDDVDDKVDEWLAAGTRLVIVINPRKRKVTLHRFQSEITVLTEQDILKFDDIVPGFSYPVVKIFV